MPPAGSICIRPFSKLGGKDVTIGVDHLNRGCSIYLNSEDSASYAILIDQHELLSADLVRSCRRLCVDRRRSEVASSEAAHETSSQG